MPHKFSALAKGAKVLSNVVKMTYGKISSIGQDGRTINVQNVSGGELRDIRLIAPYGISSCGTDGMFVQMVVNDSTNNSAVGVFDPKKPSPKPGELRLYSAGGVYITLTADGQIRMATKGASIVMSEDTITFDAKKYDFK